MRLALLLALVACGRVDFDALDDSAVAFDDVSIDVGDAGDPTLIVWVQLDTGFGDSSIYNHFSFCQEGTCPTLTPGKRGTAGTFDGIDDAVRVSYASDLDVSQLTVAVWSRRAGATGMLQSLVARPYGPGSANSWEAYVTLTPQVAQGGDAVVNAFTYAPWTEGAWNHHAFTWDGTNMIAYANGVAVDGPTPVSIAYDAHDIVIGADTNNGSINSCWTGEIDDVRIYSRVLTPAEIAALAAN